MLICYSNKLAQNDRQRSNSNFEPNAWRLFWVANHLLSVSASKDPLASFRVHRLLAAFLHSCKLTTPTTEASRLLRRPSAFPRATRVAKSKTLDQATMASKSFLMSMGTVNMWGFSPGFDMLRAAPALASQTTTTTAATTTTTTTASDKQDASVANTKDTATTPEPICVLLVGPGDIRHVLATIAHRRRYDKSRPVHIYVFEKSIEVLARHLLLLQIAQDWHLPLRQRCNLFLEVFGNARVQVRTYVRRPWHERAVCVSTRVS